MRNKLGSNPEISEIDINPNIMEVFNKLNDKCDLVIEKINKRKEKKKNGRKK